MGATPSIWPILRWPLLIAFLIFFFAAVPLDGQLPPGPQPPASGKTEPSQQAPPPKAKSPAPQSAIAVETTLVNFDVLVTDEDGRILSGLKRGNFRLTDNGREQPITNFAPVNAPITIVMLMEYSGIAYDYFAYKAASWGSDFLNHLEPEDYVALVTYDMKPTVRVDFSRNKAQIRDALGALSYPTFREANLFGAMLETLDRLERVRGKKSILLITTGANTFSAANFGDVQRRLREIDATVFCIGTAEAEYMASESRGYGSNLSYLQSKNQLDAFAKITGGNAWFPRFQGELPSIVDSVAVILRNQYRLGFSPPESMRDGKYHKLNVSIVGPDGKPLKATDAKGKNRKVIVYAREGYVAPKPSQEK
ncbi:MAG: VWA domain-containing protein [Acidobacteriota bacterium]|nr:VWA domain-containing protein [Acidobacteriota bacterium]